ncbi:MAG: uroporphyrinogen decarboxylase family protein [Lachnospiraceae bacterium]|nr:uroporphyrinogen decarboxylase family protein [Lachnospiraceae bacterium]
MLTKRQNLLETIRGGNPDRFVNQYEFLHLVMANPFALTNANPKLGEHNKVNAWGVTKSWPEGTPGPFPVHTPDKIVIKDIEDWKSYVKAPNVIFSEAEWEPFIKEAESVDRSEYFVAPFIAPGIFEQCHYLMEIQNCLIAFYENPDEMKDLIKYIADWECLYAEQLCKYLKIDALFHHDDWGSQISTFISPDMFEEFYLDAYKQVYGCYRENGVELIVHHSDSYAATLVPYMIDMGIDIWQGVMKSNDIASLIQKYGGQISFMGGIDSAEVDFEGWTQDVVAKRVKEACETYGKDKKYFIPCGSQGGPMSTYPGVYEAISAEIENMNKIMF